MGWSVLVTTGVFVFATTGVFVFATTGVFVFATTGVFVFVTMGVFVFVTTGVLVLVAVGVGVATAQLARVIELASIVTAPFCARARPDTPALVFSVMLASASTLPTNVVPVPSVAELPTCQNTLQLAAPLISRTDAALAVVSVLPI